MWNNIKNVHLKVHLAKRILNNKKAYNMGYYFMFAFWAGNIFEQKLQFSFE